MRQLHYRAHNGRIIFIFSLLASLYPALRLFFLQPVSAMRAV